MSLEAFTVHRKDPLSLMPESRNLCSVGKSRSIVPEPEYISWSIRVLHEGTFNLVRESKSVEEFTLCRKDFFVRCLFQAGLLLFLHFTLNMEETCSSETSVYFRLTIRCYFPGERTHLSKSIKAFVLCMEGTVSLMWEHTWVEVFVLCRKPQFGSGA
jgi:hypothetical protein